MILLDVRALRKKQRERSRIAAIRAAGPSIFRRKRTEQKCSRDNRLNTIRLSSDTATRYSHSDADRDASDTGLIKEAGSRDRHLAAPLLAPLESRMYDISPDRELHRANEGPCARSP
jgi:hypothetical protein